MSAIFTALRLACALGLTALLAGCIGTTFPILGDWGDRVALQAEIFCTSSEGGEPTRYVVVEMRSPEAPSKFRYRFFDPASGNESTIVFEEATRRGQYLVQMNDPSTDEFLYIWYAEPNFTFSSFYGMDQVKEEAEKFAVTLDDSTFTLRVEGTPGELRRFFAALGNLPRDSFTFCIPA
jgi:hypothetical protein